MYPHMYIYSYDFLFAIIHRTLEGPGGNEWEKGMSFGFLWLSTLVASFSRTFDF